MSILYQIGAAPNEGSPIQFQAEAKKESKVFQSKVKY
jgi:hypothetical protein